MLDNCKEKKSSNPHRGWYYNKLFHNLFPKDSTGTTGMAAIKVTALGRPNLLVSIAYWFIMFKSKISEYYTR